MDMPKPTPGHEKLKKLEGTWVGEETMHPCEWHPGGGVAFGRTTNRVELSGFAVIGDYEQSKNGVTTFTGHCVYTYDPERDLYTMHWFDCVGSPPEVFTGGFDGDVLTLAHGGPGPHARMTYDHSDPQFMVGKMEMSSDGNEWKTVFEARYTRA